MKIAWVNPGFLDYRVPVYSALDEITCGGLHVIFSMQRTPSRVYEKLRGQIGQRAVGLTGEGQVNLGSTDESFGNRGLKVPYQPGLLRAIRRIEPDVLVAEGFFQWTPAAAAYKMSNRAALVIAYERTSHTERNAGLFRLVYRKAMSRVADAFACNGSLSKEFCTNTLRISESRIVTGVMAADTDSLYSMAAEPATSGAEVLSGLGNLKHPIFLFVGRLIGRKGVRELIAAWKIYCKGLAGRGSLVLIGEGPEWEVVQRATNELPNISLCGHVNYDLIAKYYGRSDVLVMPTLEDNWSLVVPEAMACGKPVLCSIYNGCWPELIQNGVNGWVFDPKKPLELAKLLRWCDDNYAALVSMGIASRNIALDFTPKKAAEALHKACELALMLHRPNSCAKRS